MSTTVYPYVVIGSIVPENVFYDIRQVKSHKHDYEPGCGFQFCPKTGRQLWENRKVYHEQYNDSGTYPTFYGVPILRRPDSDDDNVLIGSIIQGNAYRVVSVKDGMLDIDDIKKRVKYALEQVNAWDESLFGIHLVTVWSC